MTRGAEGESDFVFLDSKSNINDCSTFSTPIIAIPSRSAVLASLRNYSLLIDDNRKELIHRLQTLAG